VIIGLDLPQIDADDLDFPGAVARFWWGGFAEASHSHWSDHYRVPFRLAAVDRFTRDQEMRGGRKTPFPLLPLWVTGSWARSGTLNQARGMALLFPAGSSCRR